MIALKTIHNDFYDVDSRVKTNTKKGHGRCE